MNLDDFICELQNMKRAKVGNRLKPHKIVMLLSVLDMAASGLLAVNKIYFSDSLITRFRLFFNLVAGEYDLCQPAPPFFHMRTSSFWRHQVKPGQEQYYNSLKTSGGGKKRITESIDYAYLDTDVYRFITDHQTRQAIQETLISLLDVDTQQKIRQSFKWDNPYKGKPNTIVNSQIAFSSISDIGEGLIVSDSLISIAREIDRLANELWCKFSSNNHPNVEDIMRYFNLAFELGRSANPEESTPSFSKEGTLAYDNRVKYTDR